jgi:hypothetical protein
MAPISIIKRELCLLRIEVLHFYQGWLFVEFRKNSIKKTQQFTKICHPSNDLKGGLFTAKGKNGKIVLGCPDPLHHREINGLIDYSFSCAGFLTNPIRTAAMIDATMAMANGMAKEPVTSLI